MNISNKSVLHKRLKCLVKYIATEKEKIDEIKDRADEVRECIESRAKADGYTVISSPNSGSFATKTGLRRSLRGSDEVEGQDVDIAFILKDADSKGKPLGCLIPVFEKYLLDKWSSSKVGHTKSSATISFANAKQQYDVVPLIETKRKNIQKLIRSNKEERQSSVIKHKEFVKTRSESSNQLEGVVKFNECIRLLKWWRYHKQSESTVFGNEEDDEKIPSFLINILSAFAYDECSVKTTHAETLAQWFSFLHHVVNKKQTIVFNDFIKKHELSDEHLWSVIDPMDDENNIVSNWKKLKINELSEWLAHGRDKMIQAIRHDEEGDDQLSLNCLVELFGNSITNQCKDV